ncbi:MAG: DUF5677 domain-containing protein [Sphingopyxis sp.]|uniref:DUF5677 domain-containing protein n=1 Tax=Sphingopyxis sp. TaxID=1908224 RepID=UPI003D6D383F
MTDDLSGLEALDAPALTAEYLRRRMQFRDCCKRAVRVSRGSGGIYVEGNRLAYASVLFTRIAVMSKSIERLLPDCKPKEHWDFSAVASLARNLAEAYLWYHWLCEDDVDDEIRQARFVLTYCHDHGSRGRMFAPEDPLPQDSVVMADLIARFDGNAFLRTYDAKARREALKGHKTPFVQDEVLDRMGADKQDFRLLYRFFSQHTHTGPVSFMRTFEHDRGAGVETEHEKRYMIVAVDFAASILVAATGGHLKLFPDAETRQPALTQADVIRNVERDQCRAKFRNRK